MQPAIGAPGGNGVGHEYRCCHRHRHSHGDGIEKVAGHARDGQKRQENQHDRQGCQIGGIADLVGCKNGHFVLGKFCVRRGVMPMNVFDNNDRCVDQESQRQDQPEQRDAVDRYSQQIVGEQSDREDKRNGYRDDQRFAPSEEDKQHECHRAQGNEQMLEQQIDGLIGLLSVVSRDDDVNAVRHE